MSTRSRVIIVGGDSQSADSLASSAPQEVTIPASGSTSTRAPDELVRLLPLMAGELTRISGSAGRTECGARSDSSQLRKW
jgi:hypothetical protein